jgi:thiol:disulfide interchange protein DsbD
MRRYHQSWLLCLAFLLLSILIETSVVAALFEKLDDSLKNHVLSADKAFQLVLNVLDPFTMEAHLDIAPGYYLYRSKLQLNIIDAKGVSISAIDILPGKQKEDPYLGLQEVFYKEAVIVAHLYRNSSDEKEIHIRVNYQGCSTFGVCYSPIVKNVAVILPRLLIGQNHIASDSANAPIPLHSLTEEQSIVKMDGENVISKEVLDRTETQQIDSEPDRLARFLGERQFWAIPAFFGFGVLLSFTPCMFPMIPILSSLIVGQGTTPPRLSVFFMSLAYVLSVAITYTAVGFLVIFIGCNVQIWFQSPWVLGAFSFIFVMLSLSMFGLYDLRLPTNLQTRFVNWSSRQRGGHYIGITVMGCLSVLIVSPCVAPPLIGVLTFILLTGNAVLGGLALFALSMGMGLPLLIIGAAAGHWLPRVGNWMLHIKLAFGVLLIMVAFELLGRILPISITMMLWAVLLVVIAIYMGALQPLIKEASIWQNFTKGLGILILTYGILLLVGVAAGSRDHWQPLHGFSFFVKPTKFTKVPTFHRIETISDLYKALHISSGHAVLLDFYADWCPSCKQMENHTFSDQIIQSILSDDMVALRADVTSDDINSRELLKHLGIVGPPAVLFFGPDGQEYRSYRIIGFTGIANLRKHLFMLLSQLS